MYRKCATEISVLHQQQITQALLELMRKTPYEEITVTQLCRAAGVSRRIFYHLFNNKTDALHALIDHTILESEGYRPELQDETLRFFCYWKAQSHLLDALWKNRLTELLPERMIGCILDENQDILYWLKANGWEDQTDVLFFHLNGVIGMTYRWYRGGFRESPEEMALRLKRILTRPLAGSKTSK